MAEPGAAENAIRVVYAPDTLRGKIDQIVGNAKKTYGRYFKGEDPVIPTKNEFGSAPKV